jgi:hypothetical protein
MVRWNFVPPGFQLNPDNHFAPVTLHPEILIERISLPEILLQEYVEPETLRPPLRTDRAARKRFQIPAPRELAVSLQTYVKGVGGTCPSVAIPKKKTGSKRKKLCQIKSCPPLPVNFHNIPIVF